VLRWDGLVFEELTSDASDADAKKPPALEVATEDGGWGGARNRESCGDAIEERGGGGGEWGWQECECMNGNGVTDDEKLRKIIDGSRERIEIEMGGGGGLRKGGREVTTLKAFKKCSKSTTQSLFAFLCRFLKFRFVQPVSAKILRGAKHFDA
jgi:hypothetical protein